MNTTTGTMLNDIESDLLRIGRELADTHALLNAATMVARGAAKATDADEWYSEAEHLTPLLDASDQLRTARLAILQAVREVQGTNPAIVATKEDWGPSVTIRRVEQDAPSLEDTTYDHADPRNS